MLILSLDSAGTGCGACVWRDGIVLAALDERMERGQDQRLMPLILDVMKKAGVGFDALDRIAVTRGPGSFTGLRIGLAAARGIGLASGKPVIGIDRFSIFREQVRTSSQQELTRSSPLGERLGEGYKKTSCTPPLTPPQGEGNFLAKNLFVVINSKRKELFCRFYPARGDAAEPQMMTEEQIRHFLKDNPGTIVTGDAEIAGIDFLPSGNETVTAAALAARADANDPAFLPRPLYLRDADVTIRAPA